MELAEMLACWQEEAARHGGHTARRLPTCQHFLVAPYIRRLILLLLNISLAGFPLSLTPCGFRRRTVVLPRQNSCLSHIDRCRQRMTSRVPYRASEPGALQQRKARQYKLGLIGLIWCDEQ